MPEIKTPYFFFGLLTCFTALPKEEQMHKQIKECNWISTCGFYQKYKDGRDPVLLGFLRKYCKGPSSDDCARKKYHHEHGHAPPDEMMPSGRFFRF
jgi:hypothetical protein